MPWKVTDPMDQRAQFITLHREGLYSMAELCDRFAISRKTGYKWLTRYQQGGLDALRDQSRAHHSVPHVTAQEMQDLLLHARRAHPTWGPKKVLAALRARQPGIELPAPSTVGQLFTRHGLTETRARRRRHDHPGASTLTAEAANAVWSAVRLQGPVPHQRRPPVLPADGHGQLQPVPDRLPRPALGQAGGRLPGPHAPVSGTRSAQAIRTDNGNPFASSALCGLSRLNVWWIKLGIQHQRIAPGCPQQNGRHERMHRTMKRETARPPAADHPAQQARFDGWRAEFNTERPHEAIGQRTPASVYVPSARPWPAVLPAPEYAGHLLVRRVSKAGTFRFQCRQLFLSDTLMDEEVALEEVDDGVWSILFYGVLIARLDERDWRISG